MKNLKIKKKIISILTGAVILLQSVPGLASTLNEYQYSKGNIYIVSNELDKIKDLNEDDLIVVDYRYKKDSNIKILNSYKVNDKDTMEEVIDILLKYEEEYPSNWNRSKNTLLREWQVHNQCYFANVKVSSTKDVDFNNNDEKVYASLTGDYLYESDYSNEEENVLFTLLEKDYIGYYENGHDIFRGLHACYTLFTGLYQEEIDNSELKNNRNYKIMVDIFNNYEAHILESNYGCYDYYEMCLPGYKLLYNMFRERLEQDLSRKIDYDNYREYYIRQIDRIKVTISLLKYYNFDLKIEKKLLSNIEAKLLDLNYSYMQNLIDINVDPSKELYDNMQNQINYFNSLIDECFNTYEKVI